MIKRERFIERIELQFKVHGACALLGPRQVGKTTLAHAYARQFPSDKVHHFDLENPRDIKLFDNPMLLLTPLMAEGNLVIIDEIQRRPELFPVLRVLLDEKKGKLLILGSASRELIHQSSESLAGRIGFVEVTPFSYEELHESNELWLRGGFPRSYLAPSHEESFVWRESYVKTFLEQDLALLGFNAAPQQVYRFWMMLCHYHGQTFNASEISRSLGISDHMAKKYLDILAGTFMVRMLAPWFENIQKRQVKSPKIYFRDSGILHVLLSIHERKQLVSYPRLGAFWEGFALEEVVRKHRLQEHECYFWATQSGAELDLFLPYHQGKRIGIEFKYSDSPTFTPSMRSAHEDLQLDHLYVLHPGTGQFALAEKTTLCGLETYLSLPA